MHTRSLSPQKKVFRRSLSTLSTHYGTHHRTLFAPVQPLQRGPLRSPDLCPRSWTSSQRRTLFTDGLPHFLVPPVIFTSLLLTLWGYKCIMTVLFQDKFIYMPYMPPFARSEKIADYTTICKPVEWEERRVRSLDGTKISLCVGTMPHVEDVKGETATLAKTHVVICYFQGNGSSTPPRLPLLSQVLRLVVAERCDVRCTLVALSYRGYWNSSGRASQSGIELDAQAMLQWIAETYVAPGIDTRLVLWGQSVGAGVAGTAAASYISTKPHQLLPVSGLVLETPFISIKSMLLALYPQKWLPYQYLHPFLWNHWDSGKALRTIAKCESESKPRILLMPAGRDEVVPPAEIAKLEHLCKELQLAYVRKDVIGALHTEASMRREGQEAIAKFIVALSADK